MTNKIKLFEKQAFSKKIDGKDVSIYTLNSGQGVTMQVTNFGGRVVSLWVPDKNGNYEDIVLGYENIDRYHNVEGERFLGAPVGRYANRIANGKFTIDGKEYTLPQNNDVNCLHGGLKGIDRVVWDVKEATDTKLHLFYSSPDREEGFPGKVDIDMIYSLTSDNEFKIEYKAVTDKPTHVNLSHHSFFNLKGEGNGTAMDNVLTINADKIVPINNISIPLGDYMDVKDNAFDFRKPTVVGERIEDNHEQLKNGAGYDHSWVLNNYKEGVVQKVGSLYEPKSGRLMEVYSDQPGMQFYSSNWFDNKTKGKNGKTHDKRESIALELQKFPDTPNQPKFPTTLLKPGEEYKQICIYKFITK